MRTTTSSTLALLALSTIHLELATAQGPAPIQTFYIPFPEESMLKDIFRQIGSAAAAPITSLVSISVSTDNTVIYYDHWEDGYDKNVTGAKQSSTQIWGDGNAANGCAPIKNRACTNANDVLDAGSVIILENAVTLVNDVRLPSQTFYDGGDVVHATLPLALTRSAYPGPASIGSMMAGACEVIEAAKWGTVFEAPVGMDLWTTGTNKVEAFEVSRIFVMASKPGTVITKKTKAGVTSSVATLNEGQSAFAQVNQGDQIISSLPVQAHLITGDKDSSYELRWYYLPPTDQWFNEYYAPVSDTVGTAKVYVYNPDSSKTISVTVFQPTLLNMVLSVPPEKGLFTPVLKDGYGTRFTSPDNFYAISLTDTEGGGQIYDWGYPLVPANQLSYQVIVGLGYGCTGNSCPTTKFQNSSPGIERSIVFVTPLENAQINVDYQNDGVIDRTFTATALQSIEITDNGDKDMSGANIWATNAQGKGVKIAAAWGQKGARSGGNDMAAMDMGTVVVPFETTRSSCSLRLVTDKDANGVISRGDLVEQTIEVINVGSLPLEANELTVTTPAGTTKVMGIVDTRGAKQVYKVQYTVPDNFDYVGSCQLKSVPPPPPTASPTAKPTPLPTASPTAKPTPLPTPGPTVKPTASPTAKPTPLPTPGPTVKPTASPTAKPTPLPTPGPTANPTPLPTPGPTVKPTASPTAKPTPLPTAGPTAKPTPGPTAKPTASPTAKPTPLPTAGPTAKPTASPTAKPTPLPTPGPTANPTPLPTPGPTVKPTASPTAKPTPLPTAGPTAKPTPLPTPGPTAKPTAKPTVQVTPAPTPKGSSSGDPHFKTWTGEKYDYHGECDLVLVHNPNFNNGQGLRIHIRTTRIKYFSFIEKVAVQIGNDVLEFDNDAVNFLINGEKVEENKQHHKTMLGGFVVRRDLKAISIRLFDDGTSASRKAGNVAKIDLHTRKNGFPAVIVDAGHTDIFAGSLGLLGEWGTGRKLARDGETEIQVDPLDAAEFALEWQVRDTEPSLFKESRFPQFPRTCTPPAKMLADRLGASRAKKEAEEACAHWKFDMEDCIFDVLATRDILVAEEGHIVHIE